MVAYHESGRHQDRVAPRLLLSLQSLPGYAAVAEG
jgi:hypothetical protein